MKTIGIISLLAVMMLASPASAEFYRFVDEHGNTIYTDDLSKVPEDQRKKARMYNDTDEIPAPEAPDKNNQDAPGEPLEEAKQALKGERNRLEKIQTELKEEFQSLTEDNARLRAAQKDAKTPEQIKDFNKEIMIFNTRYKAYKEKEAAYQAELDTYNDRVKAVNAKNKN